MRIGLLLPSIFTSASYGKDIIFAPLPIAIDLAHGLITKGHDVFFYADKAVKTDAHVIPGNEILVNKTITFHKLRDADGLANKYKTYNVIKADFENELTMKAYKDAENGMLDIIHSFHDFSAHYFNEVTQFPTLYTLHDPLPQTTNTIEYERLKLFRHHNYISISLSQQKSIVPLNFVANIYHGLSLAKYAFSETSSDDLVFIGRLLPDKGVATAIQLAHGMGKKLDIASSDAYTESEYYKKTIAPYVENGKISISGFFQNDKQKASFLGKGKAFLFPLQWEEPFGLVMIEAMACGTPIIAFARGSVPEIVVDGETGFLVNPSDEDIRGNFIVKKTGVEGMKEAVARLYDLSPQRYALLRSAARRRVEEKFTVEQMVTNYETVYKRILLTS
jgi:glycosyltransferase involved in cell wall biosynthesis